MTLPTDWPRVFRGLLPHAACIDIETCHWNGPIAVVGIFRPKEGAIEVTQLVRGQNLSAETLRTALAGVRLLITFNGNSHDIPKLCEQFPDVIPPWIVSLDLYEIAKQLNLGASLKVLEAQFEIERPEWQRRRKHIAVRLWKLYAERGVVRALESLLDYNKEDTQNLYFLAEKFARIATETR